jgi:ATP-dependent helicase/nuclease subunit B
VLAELPRQNNFDTKHRLHFESLSKSSLHNLMFTRVSLLESDGAALWLEVARRASEWSVAQKLELRDVVVLVPFAQLLPCARRAFAATVAWGPRIETTHTLAANLGPALPAEPGQITFNAPLDGLMAAQLLSAQAWGAAWRQRDPRGFERAVAHVVSAAHGMANAAATWPPAERLAYWARARELLLPVAGPGASARLLARVALEWASLAPPPATDRLFECQPSGWIVVQAGGADVLATRLLGLTPGLLIDTDPPAEQPFVHGVRSQGLSLAQAVCSSFEDEAQCAAAQTLQHVQRGEYPVALIAQDRALVRRVRALLARQQVRLLDETGWKLSTTRAAAQLMALLKACEKSARIDTLFDWLLAGTQWSLPHARDAVAALEVACRQHRVARMAQLDSVQWGSPAGQLWQEVQPVLQGLISPSQLPLQAWLAVLVEALQRSGAYASLMQDDAGLQVLAALRLKPLQAWTLEPRNFVMELSAFTAWVGAVLEQASFLPTAESQPAQVVLTPLGRTVLRPFAAVVLAGADHQQLGARTPPHPLLSEALLAALDMPGAAQRQAAELQALGQALRVERITFFWRHSNGAEPLSASPLLERLALARQQEGLDWPVWQDAREQRSVRPAPIYCSAPRAPAALLPQRLSASAYEALRACPYQFFALHVLRVREDDELDAGLQKRDYGTFLHAVLHAFHSARCTPDCTPAVVEVEVAKLRAVAAAMQLTQGLDDADFMPFAHTLNAFAPHYIEWLHQRDAQGARWQQGEAPFNLSLPDLNGLQLQGVLDRLDTVRGGALELIDYKTGSATALKDKVATPFEDTQLAVYAALASAHHAGPLRAFYWAVDGVRGVQSIEHPDVQASAEALMQGLHADWERLQAGAGLPAMGEGGVCQHCSARGLCRKDHWSERAPIDGVVP